MRDQSRRARMCFVMPSVPAICQSCGNVFLMTDRSSGFYELTSAGVVVTRGATDHTAKGLAFSGRCPAPAFPTLSGPATFVLIALLLGSLLVTLRSRARIPPV